MSKLGILAATALSLSLAVATPALAQRMGGGAHVGGGGAVHVGGGGGGLSGGAAFRGAPGAAAFHAAPGGAGFSPSFRGAQASMGRPAVVNGGNFAARGPLFAQGGWQGGFRHDHHRHFGNGAGFVAGLAAGSALGYGAYGPYYNDPYYYGDDYAYDDGYYPDTGYVVSSGADPAYCAQRYRSYDPASGTYLGFDGLRHPCP